MSKRTKRGFGSKARTPVAAGRRAFKKKNYREAIDAWEKVPAEQRSDNLHDAIAEAYLRQGLNEPSAEWWAKARQLFPTDPRFTYYYAQFLHRSGQIEQAQPLYEQIIADSDSVEAQKLTERVYPLLALVYVAQGEDVEERNTAVWNHLTPTWQAKITQAQQFQRRPYQLIEGHGQEPLWSALIAYDQNDADRETHLRQLTQAKNQQAQIIGHYLLGNLAAEREAWGTSTQHWDKVWQKGVRWPELRFNLSQAYYRRAVQFLADSDLNNARNATIQAYDLLQEAGNDIEPALRELYEYFIQWDGYQAAQTQNWSIAAEKLEQVHATSPSLNTAFNIALVAEKRDNYIRAAEAWREVLRRRPRKADSQNFLTEEQIGRLWRRAAENYTKAGEYYEAINMYKAAVKLEPDNLALRLELAEALLENGQLEAAGNELQRILDRNPDYVPALLKMGEVNSLGRYWWRMGDSVTRYWEKVLELEPNNAEALYLLREYYAEQTERGRFFWMGEARLEFWNKILRFFPDDAEFLAGKASDLFLMAEEDETYAIEAQETLNKLKDLHGHELDTQRHIVGMLLFYDEIELAQKFIKAMEEQYPQATNAPFYIMLGGKFLEAEQPQEQVTAFFDKALQVAQAGESVRYDIVRELLRQVAAPSQIRPYAEDALQHKDHPAHTTLVLALLAGQEADYRTAKRLLSKAARLARKESRALANVVDFMRQYLEHDVLVESVLYFLGLGIAEEKIAEIW